MKNGRRRGTLLWVGVAILATLAIAIGVSMVGGLATLSGVITPALPVVPIVAVGIAMLSLLWAVFSTRNGWRRSKRQATIEAWAKWSETSYQDRVLVAKYLGVKALSEAQGKALARGETFSGINGELTAEERSSVANAVIRILNGLERLAVGVEQDTYDRSTLDELGGFTIVRHYKRFEAYANARRNEDNPLLRQSHAYVSLERLSSAIESRSQKLDPGRFRALKE